MSRHIEVTIWSDGEAVRLTESAKASGDKVTQESPRNRVIFFDRVVQSGGHEQIPIWRTDHAIGTGHAIIPRRNKDRVVGA